MRTRLLPALLLSLLVQPWPAARAQDQDKMRTDTFNGKPLVAHRNISPQGYIDALRKDPDENVRLKAAEALGQMQPPPVEAVPALIKALKDKSSIVRNAAVEALLAIGTKKARKAVEKYRKKVGRSGAW